LAWHNDLKPHGQAATRPSLVMGLIPQEARRLEISSTAHVRTQKHLDLIIIIAI